MARKKKSKAEPFFKSRQTQAANLAAEYDNLRDVESLYTNIIGIVKEMGTSTQKRINELKEEASVYKKTKKLQHDIYNETFQRQDLEDKILQAISKGNHEEAQRLKVADLLNDKYARQNQLINKQVSLAGDLGRKIQGIFANIPGGGLLANILGIDTLGDDLEKRVRRTFAESGAGGNRGALEETAGGLFGNLLGRAGQGGTRNAAGDFTASKGGVIARAKENLFGEKGNINKFMRSLDLSQIFFKLAPAIAAGLFAINAFTKGVRAGFDKGLGFSGTGRGFLQNAFFGPTADAFESEFGKVNSISTKTAAQFRRMAFDMGLSAENAAALSKELVVSSDLTQDQTVDVLKTVQGLAKAAGVAPKAIFEDMAQNSDLFAQFAQDGAGGLAEAAIKAKSLGLNLSAVSSVAKSLLDFETSISNEFEAQVLTGKMINLDRARGLALQGKASELLDEIVSQVGGEAELRSMNILQMESLAGAVGLSVNQLQRVVQGNEASLKNPVVSKLDETNEILKAQLDTEQKQLLGQQKQDTLVTYG